MKLTPWYLAAIAPVAAIGCSGAFLGHFAVLALTVGIFVGTLSLGRVRQTAEQPTVDTTSETLATHVQKG